MIDHASLPSATGVRLDLFPAAVSQLPSTDIPSGDLKVTVTDRHIFVLANSAAGPYIVFTGVLDDYTKYDKTTRSWNVTLEDGSTIEITRANSCGCGSRLRGVRLYPAAPRIT